MRHLLLATTLLFVATPAAAYDGDRAAWDQFLETTDGRWRAQWNADTGAARRIWGAGIAAPNSSNDPRAAEIFARAFLNQHVALLAPGASPRDFRLAANVLSPDGVRSVGFFQTQDGLRVDGGQVSFRFKHDRMVVIGSEAWPRLDLPNVDRAVDTQTVRRAAKRHVETELDTVGTLDDVGEPRIKVLVDDDGTIRAARVRPAIVRTKKPIGRWEVDVALATGRVFAMRQTLMFASGSIDYHVPERRPGLGGTRIDAPATFAEVTIDGTAASADENGMVTWTSTGAVEVTTTAVGTLVAVTNEAGEPATFTATMNDGDRIVWNAEADELVDAQLITFTAAHSARNYMKTIDPGLRFLDQQLPAFVNIAEECNAFSDGTAIHFLQASANCENTGRLPDVVRHEYGHSLHAHALIQGVGSFDSSLSEGASDYFAATIVSDPGMGRGFFYTNDPLRHLDPADGEAVWPDDQGEPHVTGLIYAGALWDLRKAMIERYGEEDGIRLVDSWWYATVQRASTITTAYVEVILADDDDGDLSNGTPHVCEITEAFDRHGIAMGYTPGPEIGELVLANRDLLLPVGGGDALCPSGEYVGATVTFQIRGQPETREVVEMTRLPAGYGFAFPKLPEGEVLNYAVELELGTGRKITWPNNPADPMYEVFIGEVRPIYCTDFEDDPYAIGWASEMIRSESSRGRDEWEWGTPGEGRRSGDPLRAYSGSFVIGQDLGNDSNGRYQRDKLEVLRSIAVPVGDAPVVRLQYQRWLTVEDGAADQAEILAYGVPVWQNHASDTGDVHHLDREWRFHDVDLTPLTSERGGTVELTFSMTTNRFGSAGGWTIDDFCVVAWDGPTIVCGDGDVAEGEACDDGNQLAGDGCEVDCTVTPAPQMPVMPDPDLTKELIDAPGESCGCRSTTSRGSAAWLLGVMTLWLWRRRDAR